MAVLSLLLLVLFATAPMLAHGKEPRKCRPGSGKCVKIFRDVTGASPGNGGVNRNFATFRYGQYCGFANKNKPGVKDPCNELDSACQAHDKCTISTDNSVAGNAEESKAADVSEEDGKNEE